MSAEFPALAEIVSQGVADAIADCAQLREGIGGPATAEIITRYAEAARDAWEEARIVHTGDELEALPPETIVKTAGGTVACRFYDLVHGVVFGDDRPFEWPKHLVSELPALVLWHPDWAQP